MRFSDGLESRFEKLLGRYPVRRSALVPMLLYAQDEVGHLTPAVIAEIARRLDLTELQVNEVISYYSMLRREPMGRHHIQVCTNISCMLRRGQELFEHACKKLGIGPKEVTADGLFSLEEVECIGACAWAPALQVNYDYYHDMTPESFDKLIAELARRTPETPRAAPPVDPAVGIRPFPRGPQ